jgi:hypothetical protein
MTAVAGRDPSEHELQDFIGRVFTKASPILTWRPVKVQRITPAPPAAADVEGARVEPSMIDRLSRATTKRMVAWPVVPSVRSARGRSRTPALRALLTLVAFSLLCGSALTLCVYVLLGDDGGGWRAQARPVRIATVHVAEESFDLLLPGAADLTPSPVATSSEPAPPAAIHRTAAPRGRAHTARKGRRNEGVASHGT